MYMDAFSVMVARPRLRAIFIRTPRRAQVECVVCESFVTVANGRCHAASCRIPSARPDVGVNDGFVTGRKRKEDRS